ncbi:MAG TPA: toprim domain-containing protein [Puia sp.]|nr:toprim domain-containing protein [Puia sp.]
MQQNPASSGAIEEPKITILDVHPIQSPPLTHYIRERRISLNVAQIFCREAKYRIDGRIYYAICFKNRSGGYELRNRYFKGSSSPKDITFFDQCNSNAMAVFEGFFDFLSYLTVFKDQQISQSDFLILNSLSFFEGKKRLMESHKRILLYLDNDLEGKKCVQKAVNRSKAYQDRAGLYKGYKDLNAWICHFM